MSGILRFSESLSMGIHSIIILTLYKDKLMSVKDITAILNVSEAYLGKILQQLAKAGYIESIRGAKGGFILKEGTEHTKLIEIYKLLEGNINIKLCGQKSYACSEECSLNKFIVSMNNQFLDYFENTTIADIIKSN